MAKKKNAQISTSQAENAQAQEIFGHYQQIAATLRASTDRQQVEAALAEINALPENAQMVLLKELAREQQVDAADLLAALYEFATLKTVRKEARRSLIRLEGAKVYPHWQPPVEQVLAPGTALQLSTNPPRFWKGFVTDSRASGEVQLTLAWQQGEDYKEVRVLSFLLEFWHAGIKDFITQLESKRSFENFINHVRTSLTDVKLKDCSLAEGRRLLREALEVNTRHGTKPYRDYQLHVSLVNQLILEAPGIEDEPLLEEEEDVDEEEFDDLQGLLPTNVVSSFIEYWVDSDYDMAYQLLAQDSPLREGLAMDEWVERRDAWADTFNPGELEPGMLFEHKAPTSKLWLPNPFSKASTSTSKEIEAAWSIEMEKTPLDDDRLPELPAATASYAETGRHWFWASFTLVQEGEEWRIQSMTDEGARAREMPEEELEEHVKAITRKRKEEADEFNAAQDSMSAPDVLFSIENMLQELLLGISYLDASFAKDPTQRELGEELVNYMLLLGHHERGLVYLTQMLEHFPEDRGEILRRIARFQELLSDRLFEEEDDERAEHFSELAVQTLLDSLAIEDNLDAHITLAEILIDEGERLTEAESHLLQAQKLVTDPKEESHIEFHLGEIAEEREEYQEALKHYQRRIEIDPTDADAWYRVAEVHNELEDIEEAAANYRRAIGCAPDNIHYYSRLGIFYKDHDQLEQAIQVLEDGMRANPDSADLLTYRSTMYAESGDYHQANRLLDRAEQLDPENVLVPIYRLIYKQNKPTFSPPKKLAGPKKKGHHH